MNITETFINHGVYDVDNIVKIMKDNNLDWDEFTVRQNSYREHIHTKTIPILFNPDFNSTELIPSKNYSLFEEELSNIESIIRMNTGEEGHIIRSILVSLKSKKSIPPHVDIVGETLVTCRRIHIPIITNEKCYFKVGDDERNLKVGELWEINNDKLNHSVTNNGTTDRIHLIVDWLKTN
jgi:hypothetical protein